MQCILELQATINGYEYIKMPVSEDQQLSIFSATPARLSDCFYRVAWEGGADTGMGALV